MVPRVDVEYGPDALAEVGRKLLALDPQRFLKVLTLATAYISIYERPPQSAIEVLELCSLIARGIVS